MAGGPGDVRSIGELELPVARVHVELTSLCNFACEFCPNPELARPGGRMEFAHVEAILSQLQESDITRQVVFHQQGEPLLYPRLADAVARATELGLTSCVTTNGALLTDERIDRLLSAGLDQLVISLQTPDAEAFRIRGARNLSFEAFADRVVAAVGRVLRSSAETEVRVAFLTKPLPRLTLPTVGRDWHIVETNRALRAMLLHWGERFLDGVPGAAHEGALRRAIARTGVLRRNEVRIHPRLVLEARPVGEWPRPEVDHGRRWRGTNWGTCHGISEHFAILWDGSYAFCCADHNGRTTTARFPDTTIVEYLASAPVQAALRGFKRLRPVHPYCRLCLGGPHPVIVLFKAVGSIAYFKLFNKLRRESQA